MKTTSIRRIGKPAIVIIVTCYALSALWGIPYIFTLIAASLWILLDHLVTEEDEDDFLFDWHSPSTTLRISWIGIGLRALVLAMLCFLAIQYPAIRLMGS